MSEPAGHPQPRTDPLGDMPALYHERTSPGERERHEARLRRVAEEGGLVVDVVPGSDGAWQFEIITTDWDEPGLLDKLFEAVLRCHTVPEGVAVRRARIFTGAGRQVVNMLELTDRRGRELSAEGRERVLAYLRDVRPEERDVLETIQNLPVQALIPLVGEVPSVDNDASPAYTRLQLSVERISNRFTSVLLHFLARSELWLNIQVADFRQGERGHYEFHVVDKRGHKLDDAIVLRLSLLRTLEAINGMLTRFNVTLLRRRWRQRIEHNEATVYHSRPDFSDYLADLADVRAMAGVKGIDGGLPALERQGLLDAREVEFLGEVEAFVNANMETSRALRGDTVPDDAAVEVCRTYFAYRRAAGRILMPLFDRLAEMRTVQPLLSDRLKLRALAQPLDPGAFALDGDYRLYLVGEARLEAPERVLDVFHLLARTDCYLRGDTREAVAACLADWTPGYQAAHKDALGPRFLALLDESIHQGNAAIVLRNLRGAGVLARYVPYFEGVQGRIHVTAEHAYTVDEHSVVAAEALLGLRLLGTALPTRGKSDLRADYERLHRHGDLKNYARKYAMELRMLERVTSVRGNRLVRPFFRLMDEVRRESLEYLIAVNLLEHGYDTCMTALTELEGLRAQQDTLIRGFIGLSFADQRLLVLTALFHDLKKPAVDHDARGADVLADVLDAMGLALPPEETETLRWLVAEHLRVRTLVNDMAAGGESVLADYVRAAGDPHRVRLLVLFTYADRLAVRFDANKNAHDAMVMSDLLRRVDEIEGAG